MEMLAERVPERHEIPEAYTWNLASIFPSEEHWAAELARLEAELPALERFRGQLASGAAVVADCFAESERIFRPLGQAAAYARLGADADTTDERAAARAERARGVMARAQAAIAYRDPELKAIGFDELRRWAAEEPRLAVYQHYFDRLERQQAHVRSAEVEALLREVADPFGAVPPIATALADTDLTFRPARSAAGEAVEVAQANYRALIQHPDRELRRTAWESYADGHLAMRHTFARTLSAAVRQHVFVARARGYGSSLEAALEPKFVPLEVFHQLIATYRRNLSIWHRYWRVRRRALGYETLHVYDTRAPLTPAEPRIPYDQAVDWIVAGLRPLGDEYVAAMRQGLVGERWVDVYPNRGKRSGAYSGGAPGTLPFILTSYTDDISSLSTLAHELGHSLHHLYTWRSQPLEYSRSGSFLGEVASTFNQALVRAHLLSGDAGRDMEIAVLEEALSNFHRYFFVMPALARFELEIHERAERGQGLTAASLNALLRDLFAEAYGGEVTLDDERVGITWAQFPTHLYLNFYTFEYATGISAAHALAAQVLAGDAGAVARYHDYLRAGASGFPLEILRRAGVDMATPEPVERTYAILEGYVERLEQLLLADAPPG
jgi:oligoendopeptidase F